MKHYAWNVYPKDMVRFTLADAMYAMTLGYYCECGDGKAIQLKRD